MRALTIDAYWAWAIVHGPKRIENRCWQTQYRGPLVIHAGKTTSRDDWARRAIRSIDPSAVAPLEAIESIRGHLIGVVELVDCKPVGDVDDPWAFGEFCFVLEDVRPIERPVFCSGLQRLWIPPREIIQLVEKSL